MKVPIYDGKDNEAYHFKQDMLDNGGAGLEINWFVTVDALVAWNMKHNNPELHDLRSFESDPSTVHKIGKFLDTLMGFIKKFDGYPTKNKKVRQAVCIFCDSHGTIEQQINFSDDLRHFYLFIDIAGLKTPRFSPEYVMKHELFHGVARARENEQGLIKLMEKHSSDEEHILKKHFNTIQSGIRELEKYVEKGGESWKDVQEQLQILQKEDSELHYLCKHEFGTTKLLLEMLGDSILTIIAMETGDEDYIREAVEEDGHNFRNLAKQVRNIKRIRKTIEDMEQEKTGDVRMILETHKITLILIELILFFSYLPIKGSPVLAVQEKFRDGSRNKFHKGPLYSRAQRNNDQYMSEASDCGEGSFIKKMLEQYLACIENNMPDPAEPFRQLHHNVRAYEKLGESIKEKFLSYLKSLDDNIETLRHKKIWP